MRKDTIYNLCIKQMWALSNPMAVRTDDRHKIGLELWKRLKPIFLNLSKEMETKSMFHSWSVWVLDDSPYDYVLCESINKNTGELGFRLGISYKGLFLNETLYLPKDVDTMKWEDIIAFAVKHDEVAMQRNTTASAFWYRP